MTSLAVNSGVGKILSLDPNRYGVLFDLFRRSSNEEEILRARIFEALGGQRYGSLLDIGAGDGSITQRLMVYFNDVVAIDKLDSNILFLKSLGIAAEKCSWQAYRDDRYFDVILASHVMYHFPKEDWNIEMSRMQDLLSPNGRLFVIINSQEGEFANFLARFYPRLHGEFAQQPKAEQLVKKNLIESGASVAHSKIQSEVIFENQTHFLSLCRFLLDYDFDEENAIVKDLLEYFDALPNLEGERKKMTIVEDFITITRR